MPFAIVSLGILKEGHNHTTCRNPQLMNVYNDPTSCRTIQIIEIILLPAPFRNMINTKRSELLKKIQDDGSILPARDYPLCSARKIFPKAIK